MLKKSDDQSQRSISMRLVKIKYRRVTCATSFGNLPGAQNKCRKNGQNVPKKLSTHFNVNHSLFAPTITHPKSWEVPERRGTRYAGGIFFLQGALMKRCAMTSNWIMQTCI